MVWFMPQLWEMHAFCEKRVTKSCSHSRKGRAAHFVHVCFTSICLAAPGLSCGMWDLVP